MISERDTAIVRNSSSMSNIDKLGYSESGAWERMLTRASLEVIRFSTTCAICRKVANSETMLVGSEVGVGVGVCVETGEDVNDADIPG